MSKTFTLTLTFIRQRIRISLLRSRIKHMSNDAYLDLWDRVELKNKIDKLNNLEHEEKFTSPSIFSLP